MTALEFYRRSPPLMFLADEADAPASELTRDLQRVLDELGAAYVVIHPQLLTDQRRQGIISLIERTEGLEKLYADEEIQVFRRR